VPALLPLSSKKSSVLTQRSNPHLHEKARIDRPGSPGKRIASCKKTAVERGFITMAGLQPCATSSSTTTISLGLTNDQKADLTEYLQSL
jgi:hypothetical protein